MKLARPSAWLFRADNPDRDQPAWKPVLAALADCLAMLAAIGVAVWTITDTGGVPAAWGALCLAAFAAMVSFVTFGVTLGGTRALLPLYQATAATQRVEARMESALRALQSAEERLGDVEGAMVEDSHALRAATALMTEGTRTLEAVREQLLPADRPGKAIPEGLAPPSPKNSPAREPLPPGATPVDVNDLERMYLVEREGDGQG